MVDEDNPKSIFGPIVIDLDADEESFDQFGKPSNDLLELAKNVTFIVVQHLGAAGVSNIHRRVYFSGHKGFHVHYVLPGHSDLHGTRPRRSTMWYNEIKKLREALHLDDHIPVNIDRPHNYVRLSASVNL